MWLSMEKKFIIDPKEIQKKKEFLRNNKKVDKFFSDFPKFYINLDRSEDRKERLIEQMSEYKIKNFNRIKAIDGKDIVNIKNGSIDQFKYKINTSKKYNCSELAITLSHLKAILQTTQMSIIMEDDIDMILVPHWTIKFQNLIKMIPEDCDIFLLANRENDLPDKIKIKKVKNKKEFTGVCYIITDKGRKTAQQLIKNNTLDIYFSPIFDLDFLERFVVYTSNTSFFLLDNMVFESIHIDQKDTFDCKKKSCELIDHYYYKQIKD
jgi:GR25 family glycosyltransferase involved in LPS biosynthesis